MKVVNRELTPIHKIGEHQIYVDDKGRFMVQIGETWEQKSTLTALRKLLNATDGKQVKGFVAHNNHDTTEYMIERGEKGGFAKIGERRKYYYGVFYAYDAKIIQRLAKLRQSYDDSEKKFEREHEAILKSAVTISEETFDRVCAEQTQKGINKV